MSLCTPSMDLMQMGCKSPVGETAWLHERPLREANFGRATDRGEEGYWKPAG